MLCCLLVFVLCLLAAAAPKTAQAQSLWSVSFGGNGYVECSDNEGNPMPAPHYRAPYLIWNPFYFNPAVVRSAAAVRGQSIKMTVVLETGSEAVDCGLEITRHELGSADNYVDVQVSPTSVPIHIEPYGSQTVEFTITMPNEVKCGPLSVMWNYYKNSNLVGSGGWISGFYCLYNWPTSPQTTPWVGVLAYACTWAEGKSTYDTVAEEIVQGLFHSMLFVYDANEPYWLGKGDDVNGLPVAPATFNLSGFLASISGGYQNGDCRDVSSFLTICANAVGLNFDIAAYWTQSTTSSHDFLTNPICGIGNDPSILTNYLEYPFQFHPVAHRQGTLQTYDAVAAQRYTTNLRCRCRPKVHAHRSGVFHHTYQLAIARLLAVCNIVWHIRFSWSSESKLRCACDRRWSTQCTLGSSRPVD